MAPERNTEPSDRNGGSPPNTGTPCQASTLATKSADVRSTKVWSSRAHRGSSYRQVMILGAMEVVVWTRKYRLLQRTLNQEARVARFRNVVPLQQAALAPT